MSANINFNKEKGTYSFVSHKEPAWHKLGTIVDDAMTSKEAIKLANLDYTIDKAPIYAKFNNYIKDTTGIKGKQVENTFATYRTDTLDIFGTVSDRYEIVQNTEAFKFMDSIVGKDKAIYETAGALGNGEVVFITAKLPYYIILNGYDTIENYLVVSISHDGSRSVSIFLTPIRVVCQNTLAYGYSQAKFKFNLRHTTNVHDKISDASNILQISKTITQENEELYKKLTNIKIDDKEANDYFTKVILNREEYLSFKQEKVKLNYSDVISTRKKNILLDIMKYYQVGVGQDNIIGTGFGVYNAITGYLSNIKKYTSEDKKMESLVLGGSDNKLNNKALVLAQELLV